MHEIEELLGLLEEQRRELDELRMEHNQQIAERVLELLAAQEARMAVLQLKADSMEHWRSRCLALEAGRDV